MAIELEVGKRYVTRDGSEYTAPLEQLTNGFLGSFVYIATTYKIGTEASIATRTWTYGGSWTSNGENELDLIAEYNPEEIKMIGKVVVNIEAGKTYRTREGKEVTLEPWDEYPLTGSNGFIYCKSLTGSVYANEHSEFDIVEEVVKEPVTTFTTQQEIYKHLASGGYVRLYADSICGFTEEGTLAVFDNYGSFMYPSDRTFTNASSWQVATIEPMWYENIPEQGILCWVDDNSGTQLRIVTKYRSEFEFHFKVEGTGVWYKNATPLTLEEIKQYIYQGE